LDVRYGGCADELHARRRRGREERRDGDANPARERHNRFELLLHNEDPVFRRSLLPSRDHKSSP
jgi:hypothetical protein